MSVRSSINTQGFFINEDVLSVCYPFYYIKTILCLRDFNINDKYVRKISIKNILCTIYSNCVMVYLFITTMKFSNFSMAHCMLVYKLMYCEFLFYFIGVSLINLYYSTATVQLLSIMHEIHRSLYCGMDSKKFKFIARASVSAIVLCSAVFFVFKVFCDLHWTWMRAAFVSVTLFLDLEIVHIVLFIYIITCKTRKWNDDIENINPRNDNDDVTIDIDSNLDDMNNVLYSLIEAWNLMTETSGLKVVLHFITSFSVTLVYVTVMTFWLKGKFYDTSLAISHTVGITLILPKMILVEISLSVCCEAFYAEIARAKCNIISKSSQELRTKRRWKNILRVLDTEIQEMTATGGFQVDAVLMVQFIRTVTAYTVVLLQFAFLW